MLYNSSYLIFENMLLLKCYFWKDKAILFFSLPVLRYDGNVTKTRVVG